MKPTRRAAVLSAIVQGDGSLATCDSCGADAEASVEPVAGAADSTDRIIYKCPACGLAWMQAPR